MLCSRAAATPTRTRTINGFSLTHLSGTGCPSYQDVPILPTVGRVPAAPSTTQAEFSHGDETATPGRYHVTLQGPSPIGVTLAVTERTGIASFAFPAGTEANVLFKVADSVNPVSAASVKVVGRDEIEGQVTSGQFCQTGTNYTLHFVAQFDHPFAASGTFGNAGQRARCGTMRRHHRAGPTSLSTPPRPRAPSS